MIAVTSASPAKGSTKPSLKKTVLLCLQECTDVYDPVCAGNEEGPNQSFANECVFQNRNCEQPDRRKYKILIYCEFVYYVSSMMLSMMHWTGLDQIIDFEH